MKVEAGIANQLYDNALRQTAPMSDAGSEGSFADALEAAARNIFQTLETSESQSVSAMSGEAEIQEVVEAIVSAEMALQSAVVIRDRMVEAYQEILRMPV